MKWPPKGNLYRNREFPKIILSYVGTNPDIFDDEAEEYDESTNIPEDQSIKAIHQTNVELYKTESEKY